MKELTVAQGNLRCGECDIVFNAMHTLTTTLPKKKKSENEDLEEGIIDPDVLIPQYTRTSKKAFNRLPILVVFLLSSLLISQFLYDNKRWFTHEFFSLLSIEVCLLMKNI
jgi:hypothetical protein